MGEIRMNKFKSMVAVVECKWPHNPYWETIAAFDNEPVASTYAERARRAQRGSKTKLAYRVLTRTPNGREWTEVQL
jgi:hypothetical protein